MTTRTVSPAALERRLATERAKRAAAEARERAALTALWQATDAGRVAHAAGLASVFAVQASVRKHGRACPPYVVVAASRLDELNRGDTRLRPDERPTREECTRACETWAAEGPYSQRASTK